MWAAIWIACGTVGYVLFIIDMVMSPKVSGFLYGGVAAKHGAKKMFTLLLFLHCLLGPLAILMGLFLVIWGLISNQTEDQRIERIKRNRTQ